MENHTIIFKKPVSITATTSIAGPKEAEGPLQKYFHNIIKDDLLGQKSFEMAEIKMHIYMIKSLLNNAHLTENDIDCVFAGDLLDEIIGSNYTMREYDIPYCGMYNACATYGEALIMGAVMISSDIMKRVICSTTSHFSSAERQYRNPLELGSQRPPVSQWTVTGGGSAILSNQEESNIKITCATIGRVMDFGVRDANNFGAAMAPAAMDTIITHLKDTKRDLNYYDFIVTGDLGKAGLRILTKLMKEKGYDLNTANYDDCGVLVFNTEYQKTEQGGSGAGCSSMVFNSYIYKQMKLGKIKKVLLVPTGALVSKIASLQGETIPAIAHAVAIEVI